MSNSSNLNDEEQNSKSKIVAIGCGGGGANAISRLYNIGGESIELAVIDRDESHLDQINADKKIILSDDFVSNIHDGTDSEVDLQKRNIGDKLENLLRNSDLVFVAAGMGGDTGTVVSSIVANCAKEQGAQVIAVIGLPFNVEKSRIQFAEVGIRKLRENADSVILIDNNKLINHIPNLSIEKAFSVTDQILSEIIKNISELLVERATIDINFSKLASITEKSKFGTVFIGGGTHSDTKQHLINDTLDNPFLEIDLCEVTDCLVIVNGDSDLSMNDISSITSEFSNQLDVDIIEGGGQVREDITDQIRVFLIPTGSAEIFEY